MTSRFDSFDETRFGAFNETRLLARGIPEREAIIIGMTWIDESGPYRTQLGTYLNQLEALRAWRASTTTEIALGLLWPFTTQFSPADLLPPGENFPAEDFRFVATERPGSLEQYLAMFSALAGDKEPIALVVDVDQSGSLVREELQPTLDTFLDLVPDEIRGGYLVDGGAIFPEEQWIISIMRKIQDAIPGIPQ